MAQRNWTAEQQEAISFRGNNLLVAASAGSGKTSVLVERVISLITGETEHGFDLSALLIVTFTNAAAAEMKERIADALVRLQDETENQLTGYREHGRVFSADEIYQNLVARSERMKRQRLLLGNADISTIHSFCLNLIKDNIHLIDLDPNFRLVDPAESALMKMDVLEDVLEEKYAEESNSSYAALVESFGDGRDDSAIGDVILQIYSFVQSYPWPNDWLEEMTEKMNIPTEEAFQASVWYAEILSAYIDGITSLYHTIRVHGDALLSCFKKEAPLAEAVAGMNRIQHFYRELTAAQTAGAYSTADNGAGSAAQDTGASVVVSWERLKEMSASLGDLSCLCPRAGKGEEPEIKQSREEIKAAVKEFAEEIQHQFFHLDIKDILQEFRQNHELIRELSDVIMRLTEKYSKTKHKRAVLDFNDLEHLAIQILYKKNGEELSLSEAALRYQKKYAMVLVDEYQDSNLTQEYIIAAVSSGNNTFMVGDVKQSIYRFRQAMPELFLNKYKTYRAPDKTQNKCQCKRESEWDRAPERKPEWERDRENENADIGTQKNMDETCPGNKILLYTNFRSEPQILSFINVLFSKVMSQKAGELDYTQEEWLIPGLSETEDDSKCSSKVEIHMISKAKPEEENDSSEISKSSESAESVKISELSEPSLSDESSESDESREASEIAETVVYEARLVAEQISRLLKTMQIPEKNGTYRDLKYQDIAILMRAVENTAASFSEELNRFDIPTYTDAGTGYFSAYEVTVMIAVLKIIDNPLQDVQLLTVLLSPIFSFSPEEVAALKLHFDKRTKQKHMPDDKTNQSGLFYDCLKAMSRIENTEDAEGAAGAEDVARAEDGADAEDIAGAEDVECIGKKLVEKVCHFINQLTDWREFARDRQVSELVWHIMMSTDFYLHARAMPCGEQRQANLKQFFEYAKQYEKTSYKGIFNFIRFIDKMMNRGSDFAGAKLSGEGTDSVRIMSIHKSKGLEFPVVFVVGCGRKFNQMDLTKQIILHREKGFGPNYIDLQKRIKDNSIPKKIIKKILKNETISEEMRILYVALTRAKNKLFIVGTFRDADKLVEKIDKFVEQNYRETGFEKLNGLHAQKANHYMYWILTAMALHEHSMKAADEEEEKASVAVLTKHSIESLGESSFTLMPEGTGQHDGDSISAKNTDRAEDSARGDILEDNVQAAMQITSAQMNRPGTNVQSVGMEAAIRERLTWSYPHPVSTQLPLKVSVTEMSMKENGEQQFNRLADSFGEGYERTFPENRIISDSDMLLPGGLKKPDFLGKRKRFSKAQIGSFTHLILEKANFNEIHCKDDLDLAIDKMIQQGFLSSDQASTADRESLMRFFHSEAGHMAKNASAIHKETIFTVKLTLDEYQYYRNDREIEEKTAALKQRVVDDQSQRRVESEDFVLLQGSIDCWFETNEGTVVIDYKTGYSAELDLKDAESSVYRKQLDLYAFALKKITGMDVWRRYLYMLSSGQCVLL